MLHEIEIFAKEVVAEFAAKYPEKMTGWRFSWANTKNALGRCCHDTREIQLSKVLVPALKDQSKVIDTLLHEIAHALAGPGQGHGRVWKNWCVRIGANPSRCYDARIMDTTKVDYKYSHTCSHCGSTGGHSRRWNKARYCLPCYKRSGGIRYPVYETQNY